MTGRAADIEKRYEAGGNDSKKWTTVVGREIDFFFNRQKNNITEINYSPM